MLPILQREVVEKKGWATEEELTDYFAIGQCTPGVIAVNTATFIGQKYRGNLGGTIATLGVVFPSLVIITIIAAFLTNFAEIPVVQHALAGGPARPGRHQRRRGGHDRGERPQAGQEHREGRPVCVHFPGGAGPVRAGRAAGRGRLHTPGPGAGPPVLPGCAGGAGRNHRAAAGPPLRKTEERGCWWCWPESQGCCWPASPENRREGVRRSDLPAPVF